MFDVSEKVLVDLRETMIKASEKWNAGVCLGQVRYPDGKQVCGTHSACHSWVTSGYTTACYDGRYGHRPHYAKDAKPFLIATNVSKVRSKSVCSEESLEFLVRWVAKESPFSEFVLNKDDDEWLTTGGVVLYCGPGGLEEAQAMWMCKLLRFPTEGAKAAETFMTLVKGGVDPMLAVLVASHVRSVRGATFGYTGIEGHSSVFGYGDLPVSPEGLLARNITPSKNNNTQQTMSLFSPPKGCKADRVGDKIKTFCKPIAKDDGWGGVVKGNGADGDTLIKHVLEWEGELRKKIEPMPVIERAVAAVKKKLPGKNTVFLDLDM